MGTIYSRVRHLLGVDHGSDALTREQFRLLAEQIPLMYGVVIVNSLFMAWATLSYAGWSLAFTFPALAIPVMAYRVLVWRKRSQVGLEHFSLSTMRKALNGNVIAANVLAALLALWATRIMATLPADALAFVPLFTILSMVVCAYCMASYPIAAYSVIVSGSTYIAYALFSRDNPMLSAMAANIFLVSVLITYMVSRQYSQLRHLIESHGELASQRAFADDLAHRDQLTGLPNRRGLLAALHYRAQRAPDLPVGVVMIDMNGFKPVNDTYGHSAGDRLLVKIGKRIEAAIRPDDFVARLGGDEFCVLLNAPRDQDSLQQRTEAILDAISGPLQLGEHQLQLGASLGVAARSCIPDNPLELIQHADIALYEAKGRGGSAISLFEGQMEARVHRRTRIEQALSDPGQMEMIDLNFQPIFDLRSGEQLGFEALARWDHHELGRVSPREFVDAAERSGLATRLSIHLFSKALETARQWHPSLMLSFNLSGSGLGSSGLERIIPQILTEKGFPANRVALEVTETALLRDATAVRGLLGKLQKTGMRIVLDDFGAGYASIGYLRKFHFDGIKLDGSLIRDIARDDKSRALLLGVLQLCQAIGATVTAEMVESEEQLALLHLLPVDQVQGFLLGRPQSSAATVKANRVRNIYRDDDANPARQPPVRRPQIKAV
jgi:diguanylate cyclase (GGDEF)-like protein